VVSRLILDVDPKSVLCVFFKQGLCQKGNKCKYSHDLSMQQKTAKRNIYVDSRDVKADGKRNFLKAEIDGNRIVWKSSKVTEEVVIQRNVANQIIPYLYR
jgi:hypothetical protein